MPKLNARKIVKDLATDVENAAAAVVLNACFTYPEAGGIGDATAAENLRLAVGDYRRAVHLLARATGVGQ